MTYREVPDLRGSRRGSRFADLAEVGEGGSRFADLAEVGEVPDLRGSRRGSRFADLAEVGEVPRGDVPEG
jgi:hypothetical protein